MAISHNPLGNLPAADAKIYEDMQRRYHMEVATAANAIGNGYIGQGSLPSCLGHCTKEDAPQELYDLAVSAINAAKNRSMEAIQSGKSPYRDLSDIKYSLENAFSKRQYDALMQLVESSIVELHRESAKIRLTKHLFGTP